MTGAARTGGQPSRGGAPVGYLEELPPLEAASVLYLRLWSSGAESQARATEDFRTLLGDERGDAACGALAALVDVIARHSRRPLMRHGVGCKCLRGDEAAFANMVAAAAEEAQEDALILASLFMRPDMAFGAVTMAQEFGHALQRMVSRVAPGRDHVEAGAPPGAVLH